MHSQKPEQSINAALKTSKNMCAKSLTLLSFINYFPVQFNETYNKRRSYTARFSAEAAQKKLNEKTNGF